MVDNSLALYSSAFLVAFVSLLVAQLILHSQIASDDLFDGARPPGSAAMSVKTIESFGYKFNEKGQLRKFDRSTGKSTDEPFQFKISESHAKNQQHYEELGEAITDYVYRLLESEAGLKKIYTTEDPQSFFYASEDALTNADKLMVLIHGSGVVRAGQWARSLIINDNLESGTQLPYIKRAKDLGYAVIVTNSNHEWKSPKDKRPLLNPQAHMEYVWNEFINKSPAKFKAVVAHSYGGYLVVEMAKKFSDFRNSIKAIAMTDSVHDVQKHTEEVENYLISVSKNWVSSNDPLDVSQKTKSFDIPRVSAGTPKHEVTSHAAINSVFDFIESKNK